MTNKEAIHELRNLKDYGQIFFIERDMSNNLTYMSQAFDMAIEALENQNKFNSFAIYFHNICPYTKKKCDDWNCSKCEVEITEQEFAEGD